MSPLGIDRSLFTRVVRYRPSQGRNPREDSLTEVFAAVLERVPGLALHLVKGWVDPDQSHAGAAERSAGSAAVAGAEFAAQHVAVLNEMPLDTIPRVATQVVVGERRVDLELRLSASTNAQVADVLVRVEVKHGANPERDQLLSYVDTLPQSMARAAAVVLLAPRADLARFDERQIPVCVAQRTWQRTAREITQFRSTLDDPVDAWLVDELITFLDQERLMDLERLRPRAPHRPRLLG